MNPMIFHRLTLTHHHDLLREAQQQRAVHLAQQAAAKPTLPPIVLQRPVRQTPCPPC